MIRRKSFLGYPSGVPLPLIAAVLVAYPVASKDVRIVLGGDLMLNRAKPGRETLAGVRSLLRSGDLSLANLEIPLTTWNRPTPNKTSEELKRKDQFVLKGSPGHVPFIWDAGIRLVSLGNNHCMDYGATGLSQMQAALRKAGIAYAGAGRDVREARKVSVVRLPSGVKVGLVSAMAFLTQKALDKTTPAKERSAGVNTLSFGGTIGPKAKASLREWVSEAHRECDYLVVALHWGVERKDTPNAYQVALGRAVADAGADVVWGHHPHVLQGAEIYRGVPILYSMGNLVSSLPADTGFVRLSLGRRPSFEFFPARISGNRCTATTGPKAASEKRRFESLCRTIQRKYPDRNTVLP